MKRKKRIKKILAIKHRKEQYNHAIQKVINGRANPEYASLRWKKLQEVNGK